MIAYLKSCLRKALKSLLSDDLVESVPREPYLDVLLQGKSGPILSKYLIVGVLGVRLQGIPVSGREQGVRLIAEHEAVDRQHFQDLWRQNNGESLKLVWEDTLEEVN